MNLWILQQSKLLNKKGSELKGVKSRLLSPFFEGLLGGNEEEC
jgi:hypothetical protein